ncbi:hypothetical protein [Lysinibacillus sp. FSL W8-0953]|uniref:hypothetical protein n=1 Tax=Lysinibacillus sp. FSL W8-0953 TaxID=2954640 RepID=UPI0030F68E9B
MFMKKEDRFYLHPGIYQFQIPFYNASLVPGEDGIVPVKYCDVEMHIGSKNNNNLIATILIGTKKEYQSPTNFIERVISVIYENYLPLAINGEDAHHYIRWVKRENYPQEIFTELIVDYSSKGEIINISFGEKLEKTDWIINEHQLQKY